MRFDRFIQRCHSEWPEFGDPRRLEKSRNPATRDISGVLSRVPGMATENKLKLLNLAVASRDDNEVYVKVRMLQRREPGRRGDRKSGRADLCL